VDEDVVQVVKKSG